jgi:hypothetical protein
VSERLRLLKPLPLEAPLTALCGSWRAYRGGVRWSPYGTLICHFRVGAELGGRALGDVVRVGAVGVHARTLHL